MNADDYVKERLDTQIGFFTSKSRLNRRWFRTLRLVEVGLAALLPFAIANVSDATPRLKLAVGAVGAVIAVTAAVLALFKFQENWIEFRTTAESLKQHRYRYLTRSPPYETEASFSQLVSNVESLLSRENAEWAQHMRVAEKSAPRA
jgi:Protein of unknown function (DUF4231)